MGPISYIVEYATRINVAFLSPPSITISNRIDGMSKPVYRWSTYYLTGVSDGMKTTFPNRPGDEESLVPWTR